MFVNDAVKGVKNMTKNDILRILGAEERRTAVDYVLPALGYFVAGAMVGTVATLLLTPKSGREMRRELGAKASNLREQIETGAGEAFNEIKGHLPGMLMSDEGENNAAGRNRKPPVLKNSTTT